MRKFVKRRERKPIPNIQKKRKRKNEERQEERKLR
jgi:hypothetical protein